MQILIEQWASCIRVLRMLQKFRESKGIDVEESELHEYPKCYKTIDEKLIESVFFYKDWVFAIFKSLNNSEKIADHLVMQRLAKLHVITLIFKDEKPDKFKEFTQNVQERFVCEQPIFSITESIFGPNHHDKSLIRSVTSFSLLSQT